jgi:hypothetical protein
MKALNILKKASLGLTALVAGLVISTTSASAIPYNGDQTVASPVPAFNVFTGVPSVGNEADFLRARVPNGTGDSTTPYVDPLSASCTPGQKIQMRVYVHNGASADANNGGTGPSVAHGVKVKVSLPATESTSFNPTATISSTNAGTVNDGVSINCGGSKVKLSYVAGSASQFSIGTGVLGLPDSIITSGASIRSESVAGDVWGCWNDRVYVLLTVQVEEVQQPQATAQCQLFSILASEDRKVTINQFNTTQTNASLKSVVVNWGDNSTPLSATDKNGLIGQTHQYAQDGTYTITAVATFAVEGQADIVSGGAGTACAQSVTFKQNQPPVITTVEKPTRLVNTGAGSVAGIFAATTALGAVGYRYFLGRRLSRQ